MAVRFKPFAHWSPKWGASGHRSRCGRARRAYARRARTDGARAARGWRCGGGRAVWRGQAACGRRGEQARCRACRRCLASCHRRSPSPTARARCFGAARPFSSCWQAPAPPGICRGSAKASPRRRRRSSGCSRPPAAGRHSPRPSRFRKWRAARPFTSRRPPGWMGPAAWNTLSGNSRRRRRQAQSECLGRHREPAGARAVDCQGFVGAGGECPLRKALRRLSRWRRRPGRCSGPGAASRSHAPGSGI